MVGAIIRAADGHVRCAHETGVAWVTVCHAAMLRLDGQVRAMSTQSRSCMSDWMTYGDWCSQAHCVAFEDLEQVSCLFIDELCMHLLSLLVEKYFTFDKCQQHFSICSMVDLMTPAAGAGVHTMMR